MLVERYVLTARATARSLVALTSSVVVASAGAAGPVRDRLVAFADSLAELTTVLNAYADGRQPATFVRVLDAVRASLGRLRELAAVLPPDEALAATVARAASFTVGGRAETRSVVTVGTFLTRSEADDAAKRAGAVERVEGGPPFVVRVGTYPDAAAAAAVSASLATKGLPSLVVDETRWVFTRAGAVPDRELWREPVRTVEAVSGTRRVALSTDGAWVATGADDGTIAIFSGDGALRALPKLRTGIAQLAFSDDGKQLIGGGVNLSIFAVPQGSTLGPVFELTSPATQVLFAPAPGARAFVAAARGPTGQPAGGGGMVNARAPDGVVLGAPFPILTPAAGATIAVSETGELYVATPAAGGAATDIEVLRLGVERTLRPVVRVPGVVRALTIDRPGTSGAALTDQGVYRFAPKVPEPAKSQTRVADSAREVAFGADGVLYVLEPKTLTAYGASGKVLWASALVDGRRLLGAARPVVQDGADRVLVFGPTGLADELGVGGTVQDVAVSLGGRRVAAVVDARRALLFDLP